MLMVTRSPDRAREGRMEPNWIAAGIMFFCCIAIFLVHTTPLFLFLGAEFKSRDLGEWEVAKLRRDAMAWATDRKTTLTLRQWLGLSRNDYNTFATIVDLEKKSRWAAFAEDFDSAAILADHLMYKPYVRPFIWLLFVSGAVFYSSVDVSPLGYLSACGCVVFAVIDMGRCMKGWGAL